jgi:hypothetical protein
MRQERDRNTAGDSRISVDKRLYFRTHAATPAVTQASQAALLTQNPGGFPKIIHTTDSYKMTNGSLSTFDSNVSCLYFFVCEYHCARSNRRTQQ